LRKIAFFAFWRQTDRRTNKQTDEQMDTIDALSRTRYGERRLNKKPQRYAEDNRAAFNFLYAVVNLKPQ